MVAKIEYSADFRSAVDGLGTAIDYALEKYREMPEAKTLEAQNEMGTKLRQISRLAAQMRGVLFPEMETKTCNHCGSRVFVEAAFWQGICYNCAGK